MIAYLTGNFVRAVSGIQLSPARGSCPWCWRDDRGGHGFLYNAYPAKVFMGDTGCLASAACWAVVVATQARVRAGGGRLFVIEAISVLTQIGWFKITKRLTGEGKASS